MADSLEKYLSQYTGAEIDEAISNELGDVYGEENLPGCRLIGKEQANPAYLRETIIPGAYTAIFFTDGPDELMNNVSPVRMHVYYGPEVDNPNNTEGLIQTILCGAILYWRNLEATDPTMRYVWTRVDLGVQQVTVIDNLKSYSVTAALSANMGRFIKYLIDTLQIGGPNLLFNSGFTNPKNPSVGWQFSQCAKLSDEYLGFESNPKTRIVNIDSNSLTDGDISTVRITNEYTPVASNTPLEYTASVYVPAVLKAEGTNILPNSSWSTDTTGWELNSSVNTFDQNVKFNDCNSIKFYRDGMQSTDPHAWVGIAVKCFDTPTAIGDMFKASFYVYINDHTKFNGDFGVNLYEYKADGDYINFVNTIITPNASHDGKWTKITVSKKIGSTDCTGVGISILMARNGESWVSNPRLERTTEDFENSDPSAQVFIQLGFLNAAKTAYVKFKSTTLTLTESQCKSTLQRISVTDVSPNEYSFIDVVYGVIGKGKAQMSTAKLEMGKYALGWQLSNLDGYNEYINATKIHDYPITMTTPDQQQSVVFDLASNAFKNEYVAIGGGGGFVISATAPQCTKVLWFNTTDHGGKFYRYDSTLLLWVKCLPPSYEYLAADPQDVERFWLDIAEVDDIKTAILKYYDPVRKIYRPITGRAGNFIEESLTPPDDHSILWIHTDTQIPRYYSKSRNSWTIMRATWG